MRDPSITVLSKPSTSQKRRCQDASPRDLPGGAELRTRRERRRCGGKWAAASSPHHASHDVPRLSKPVNHSPTPQAGVMRRTFRKDSGQVLTVLRESTALGNGEHQSPRGRVSGCRGGQPACWRARCLPSLAAAPRPGKESLLEGTPWRTARGPAAGPSPPSDPQPERAPMACVSGWCRNGTKGLKLWGTDPGLGELVLRRLASGRAGSLRRTSPRAPRPTGRALCRAVTLPSGSLLPQVLGRVASPQGTWGCEGSRAWWSPAGKCLLRGLRSGHSHAGVR